MDPQREESYIQMALDHPNMLCSEAPFEILEASSYAGDEPTEFLKFLFATGHTEWLRQKYGRRAEFPKELIDRAVYVLWARACDLYISHTLGRPDANWDQPFFSDEGLYGE
jgi:hypothetical protein